MKELKRYFVMFDKNDPMKPKVYLLDSKIKVITGNQSF